MKQIISGMTLGELKREGYLIAVGYDYLTEDGRHIRRCAVKGCQKYFYEVNGLVYDTVWNAYYDVDGEVRKIVGFYGE